MVFICGDGVCVILLFGRFVTMMLCIVRLVFMSCYVMVSGFVLMFVSSMHTIHAFH